MEMGFWMLKTFDISYDAIMRHLNKLAIEVSIDCRSPQSGGDTFFYPY